MTNWTYWGFPLIPPLIVRKILLRNHVNEEEILKTGFKPPSSVTDRLLGLLSRCESIPQHLNGSSVMMLATRL